MPSEDRPKPSRDEHYLNLAREAAALSDDKNTQHGCVLVGVNGQLAMGCNRFPRDLDTYFLPKSRDEDCCGTTKYDWLLHAEIDALSKVNFPLKWATAYLTGKSCFQCVCTLYHFGVSEIVQGSSYGWKFDDKDDVLKEIFFAQLSPSSDFTVRTIYEENSQ